MANTTYFSIPLPADGAQDWVPVLNRVLNMLTETIRRTQKPSTAVLLWGDISGGGYLEAGSQIKVFGGLDTTLQPTKNFVVESGADFPASVAEFQLFGKDGALYLRVGGEWVALGQTDSAAVDAAGGVLVDDYGGVKGNYLVSDGSGGLAVVSPGANGGVYVADSDSATGWIFRTPATFVASGMSAKGDLITRTGAGAASVVSVGADGTILTADSATLGGLAWKTFNSRLGTNFSAKGELLAGTGANTYAAVGAPASNARVLVSDAAEASGVRWAQQTELGSIPGTRTRVAGDLYLFHNYL